MDKAEKRKCDRCQGDGEVCSECGMIIDQCICCDGFQGDACPVCIGAGEVNA